MTPFLHGVEETRRCSQRLQSCHMYQKVEQSATNLTRAARLYSRKVTDVLSLFAHVSSDICLARPPRASGTPRGSNSSSHRSPATGTSKSLQRSAQRPIGPARARAEAARARRELRGLPTHAGGGTSATRASPRSSLSHPCRRGARGGPSGGPLAALEGGDLLVANDVPAAEDCRKHRP